MSRSSRLCALFKQNSTGSVTPSLSKSGRAGGAASRNETTELSQGAASACHCAGRVHGAPDRPATSKSIARDCHSSCGVGGWRILHHHVRRAGEHVLGCGASRLWSLDRRALSSGTFRTARGAQSSVAPSEAPSTVSETPSRWLPDDLRDQMRCAPHPSRALGRSRSRSAVPQHPRPRQILDATAASTE